MASHRYEPIANNDPSYSDAYSLKSVTDTSPAYTESSDFSGIGTDTDDHTVTSEAPPSFRSRINSTADIPLVTGLRAGVTQDVREAWASGMFGGEAGENELVSRVVERVLLRLQADGKKVNDSGEAEEAEREPEDGDNDLEEGSRSSRRSRRREGCCSAEMANSAFTFVIALVALILATVIAVEWVRAWGRRGGCDKS